MFSFCIVLIYSYLCTMNWKVVHIEETSSTNRWLWERTHSTTPPLPDPFCVWADYQTAGRGQGTNTWESEGGKNLLFSLLLHPHHVPTTQQFHISEAVAVALCETLEHYISQQVEVKWPNDIYVDGRKICGILIENTLHGHLLKTCIIGIGLNVNQQEFLSDAPNPVSLYQLTGHETDREELLQAFLHTFDTVLNRKTTSLDYRNRLYRRTGLHEYKDQTGSFRAEIVNVLPDGHLVLRDEEGQERHYGFKEVQFV